MATPPRTPGFMSFRKASLLTGLTTTRLQALALQGRVEIRMVPGECATLSVASVERLARELGRETATATAAG